MSESENEPSFGAGRGSAGGPSSPPSRAEIEASTAEEAAPEEAGVLIMDNAGPPLPASVAASLLEDPAKEHKGGPRSPGRGNGAGNMAPDGGGGLWELCPPEPFNVAGVPAGDDGVANDDDDTRKKIEGRGAGVDSGPRVEIVDDDDIPQSPFSMEGDSARKEWPTSHAVASETETVSEYDPEMADARPAAAASGACLAGNVHFHPASSPQERAPTPVGGDRRRSRSSDGAAATDDAARESAALPRAWPAEDMPLYIADPVPDDDERPRTPPRRRRRPCDGGIAALLAAALAIAAAAAAVAAAVVTSSGGRVETADGRSSGATAPTSAPTHSPPPVNCTVRDLGPVYDEEGGWGLTYGLGRDVDTVVAFVSDPYADGTDVKTEIEMVVGPFRLDTHAPDDEITEIAFSASSFFASNPFSWDYEAGVVYAGPKNPSGGIANETMTTLTPAHGDVDAGAQFGTSIAADGDLLVVGAPHDGDSSGSAFVYRQTGPSSWEEEAKLVPDDAGKVNFGNSVLVKDGLVVVAADRYGDDREEGAVFLYEFDPLSKSWRGLAGGALVNEECDGKFGASLAFAGDGGLLIGCPKDGDGQGAVYFYQRSSDGGQYDLVQKITAKDGEELDQFSGNNHHMAVNSKGDTIAVGTHHDDDGQDKAVYIFARFDGVWKEVARIDAPRGSCYFGGYIVISGDRILVSSWENTYLYELECSDQEQ